MITVIYWTVILLYSGLVLGLLGADGANCPIQASMNGWQSIYNITNLQEYLLIVFGGYLGCFFLLLITMLVSAKTNSSVIAVIIPFVLIFLPTFLSEINTTLLNKILALLPDQLLQLNQVVKSFQLYGIFGKIFGAVPLLLVVYGVLAVVSIPLLYHVYRGKEVY